MLLIVRVSSFLSPFPPQGCYSGSVTAFHRDQADRDEGWSIGSRVPAIIDDAVGGATIGETRTGAFTTRRALADVKVGSFPMISQTRPGIIHLHTQDNVAVASRTLAAGENASTPPLDVVARQAQRVGHNSAVRVSQRGEPSRQDGQIIGLATKTVAAGEWVRGHNLAIGEFERDYAPATEVPAPPVPITDRAFQGFRRA